VPEEFGTIPEFVHFNLMDIVVGLSEELEELGCVELRVNQAEALCQQAIETQVGPLLHATL
jgi:hypothetical protein